MSRRKWIWIAVGLGIFLCVITSVTCVGMGTSSLSLGRTTARAWRDAVAIVRVEGVIVSGKAGDWLYSDSGSAYSESIIERLHLAEDDPSVKAIVLRVNSPGGGVVASDEIYRALLEIEKPIVVSMGDMAASGGYYISSPASKIVANPTTLTGSIGVISTLPNFEELLDKIGIEMFVIKSGPMKDELSPYREPTEQEIEHWQAITDEAYEQFLGIVAEGRDLPLEEARELADGRVYTGQQALALGLVDELGNLPEAIDLAAELAGIEGEPQIIEYEQAPSLIEMLLSTFRRIPPSISLEDFLGIERRFTVQYLYISP
ncbi:MAG: signal peptide peptidase SppA [Chloroflexi bacterium B3_Chlor]|nr:MAG: signal peptide peptidase SppA [Chloroflexi bacterium B3_Chlor]